MNTTNKARSIDLGNNESATIGVVEVPGGFLALTLSSSKTFKTMRGAVAWLAVRGYKANGARL